MYFVITNNNQLPNNNNNQTIPIIIIIIIMNNTNNTNNTNNNYYTYSAPDSDWTFYTHVIINKNNNDDPLIRASDTFLKELLLDPDLVKESIEKHNFHRIYINTDGTLDIITDQKDQKDQKRGYTFLKSKFLSNKKFKQRLIEYYNPYRIYVKGPINVLKKDFTNSPLWYIDLCILK
jgi:hypothetical protein